jgi:hypothetical protein
LISETGTIKVLYNAKEVNIVTDSDAKLEIFLDGKPLDAKYSGKDIPTGNSLIVSDPNLYNIISSENSASHLMEININGKGLQMFTFTFG